MSFVLYSVTSNKELQLNHLSYSVGKYFWEKRLRKWNKNNLSQNYFSLDMTLLENDNQQS